MNFTDFINCFPSKYPYQRAIIKQAMNALASIGAFSTVKYPIIIRILKIQVSLSCKKYVKNT